VPLPLQLDFAALAEGLTRNNVGLAGITLTAEALVDAGWVTLRPTGQKFALHGAAPVPPAAGPARRSFVVVHAEDPPRTALEVVD
jgi:hypothetical protein